MSWQKCPICHGTGIGLSAHSLVCSTCSGYKIINTVTGLPPVPPKIQQSSTGNIDPIEPAIWPNSYNYRYNSNTTHNVRIIPAERPQLQELGSKRIDPVD
jgi:hypothetical protein